MNEIPNSSYASVREIVPSLAEILDPDHLLDDETPSEGVSGVVAVSDASLVLIDNPMTNGKV